MNKIDIQIPAKREGGNLKGLITISLDCTIIKTEETPFGNWLWVKLNENGAGHKIGQMIRTHESNIKTI